MKRIRVLAPAMAALYCLLSGCDQPHSVTPPAPTGVRFTRVTQEAGVQFRHTDGSSGRHYFPEVMAPGCALVDLTNDGMPDLYLVNGAPLPGATADPPPINRFFRNKGDGTFKDETATSGLGDPGYGIGCCAGDYDNDGKIDLYVTNLGTNRLYHNNGDGTFTDVAAKAGVTAGGFSTGAAFADYDGDGDLDLYVARYVVWSPETNVVCTAADGEQRVPVYCRPSVYPAAPDLLYRNNGNGTFTDVTAAAGLRVTPGRGLGVIWSDVDEDGDPDLFVANDMTANFLFINQGNGRFKEEALERGVAVGEGGQAQASMGVASVDYDGDGHLDLACTNFSGEYLALYRNLGNGNFEDVSARTGLIEATNKLVGFGIGFPDLDLDGRPDLFVANGHVTEAAERFYPGVSLAQPSLCLLNVLNQSFKPASDPGSAVTAHRVSRGAAFGDYDGDGDADVLVANWKDEPDLLRNDSQGSGHWLRLRLSTNEGNRSAIGARVEVTDGDRLLVQELHSGGSYASQSELALTFGLGAANEAAAVKVRWPDGSMESWKGLSSQRSHTLVQHTSRAVSNPKP